MSSNIKEIPFLEIESPLIPYSIRKLLFDRDGINYMYSGIKYEELNAFTRYDAFERFSKRIFDDVDRNRLLKEYIIGFRKGYFEYVEKNDFHTVTTAVGKNFPFSPFGIYSRQSVIKNKKIIGWVYESMDRGIEEGRKYKAFEIILSDPINFETLFDKLLKDYERKNNQGAPKKDKVYDNEVFKSYEAEQLFIKMHNAYKDLNDKAANYSFIFYAMTDYKDLLKYNGADFYKIYLPKYGINIDRIDSRQSGVKNNKRYHFFNECYNSLFN